MERYYLTEITTKDGLVHQGIYYEPKKKSETAILWIHGLTGRFYGDVTLFNFFAQACEPEGIGFAAFNNRGHDVVANFRKIDLRKKAGYRHAMYGAGLEHFEDCVFDIEAGITFLSKQGYTKIILAGHSTGANKVCYYAGTKGDTRVAGVILAGPMSDRFSKNTDKPNYISNMMLMKEMVNDGRGEEILTKRHFFPMTPKRWLSLLEPNTSEDVFNYGDYKNVLTRFRKIRKPLLVVFSELDETADRPIQKIQNIFDIHTKSLNYVSTIVSEAPHSYTGKEKEFVYTVTNWIKQI